MQIVDETEFSNHLHCLVVYPPYLQTTTGELRMKIFIFMIDVNEKEIVF